MSPWPDDDAAPGLPRPPWLDDADFRRAEASDLTQRMGRRAGWAATFLYCPTCGSVQRAFRDLDKPWKMSHHETYVPDGKRRWCEGGSPDPEADVPP